MAFIFSALWVPFAYVFIRIWDWLWVSGKAGAKAGGFCSIYFSLHSSSGLPVFHTYGIWFLYDAYLVNYLSGIGNTYIKGDRTFQIANRPKHHPCCYNSWFSDFIWYCCLFSFLSTRLLLGNAQARAYLCLCSFSSISSQTLGLVVSGKICPTY